MADNRDNVYEEDGKVIYRASGLGSCTKQLVALRLGYRATATPGKAQEWFDRGYAHEAACLAQMEAEGWVLSATGEAQSQIEYRIPGTRWYIRGHMDGLGKHTDFGNRVYTVEVKSPKSFHNFVDQLYSDKPDFLTEKYKWQISVYMLATGNEAMMVCLDAGRLVYHALELPLYNQSEVATRINTIEQQVREGLPQYCDMRSFPCPVYYLHEDQQEPSDDPFDVDLDAEIVLSKYHEEQSALHRDAAIAMMGEREKYKSQGSSITKFTRKNTKTDYDRMVKDYGIDKKQYQEVSESSGWRIVGRPSDGGLQGDGVGEESGLL